MYLVKYKLLVNTVHKMQPRTQAHHYVSEMSLGTRLYKMPHHVETEKITATEYETWIINEWLKQYVEIILSANEYE